MSWMQEALQEYRGKKAISHRPDLAGRVHLSSTRGNAVMADVNLNDFTDYAKVHAQHVWLKRGIKILSDNFAALPLHVIDDDGEEVSSHELDAPLRYGNEQHGPAAIWSSWIVHLILGGEAFFEILSDTSGQPLEFWPPT